MTSEALNVLRAQSIAPFAMQHQLWNLQDLVDRVDEVFAACGITADALAEPAAPAPDYRALLWALVDVIQHSHPLEAHMRTYNQELWNQARAVAAVRP